MSKVWVLLADGFEEVEALTPVDYLRRAKLDVATVSVENRSAVTGSHGIQVIPDARMESLSVAPEDLVVLPGGLPGADTLTDDPAVQNLLTEHWAADGRIAAICAAPLALKAAGILEGKRFTSYPGMKDRLRDVGTYVEAPVVVDGRLTTSRGPSTAVAFALSLIGQLKGPEVRAEIAEGILYTDDAGMNE